MKNWEYYTLGYYDDKGKFKSIVIATKEELYNFMNEFSSDKELTNYLEINDLSKKSKIKIKKI